jgi:hypothetical protein
MTEVAIRFRPNVWGGHCWTLLRRADPACEWEINGSSLSKAGAKRLLKSDETLIEEDPEPPAPLVCIPNAKQLKCKHDGPGRSWYQQMFSPDEAWRFEVCEMCKSIVLARGNVPWHLLPKGYALLRIEA